MIEIFEGTRTIAIAIHIISVIIGMGSALLSDLLFTFFSKDKNLNKKEINTLSILSKVVLISLLFIIVSGIMIFLSDIDKYINSAKYLSKITILGVLLINGYILNKYIWPHLLNNQFFVSKNKKGIRRVAFIAGAISFISWIIVFILGILNNLNMTYYQILFIYVLIIVFGSIIATIIENREYKQ